MRKLKVQKADISVGSHNEFMEDVFALSETSNSSYVCFANVHMVVEAYNDSGFRNVLNSAAIAAPDGGPISLFVRYFYGIKQPRICGMDYMPIIMEEAENKGKSVFFYGCTEEVLETMVRKANSELPDLRIAGTYSPPFRQLTEQEDDQIVEMINSSKADFVFVALGCPKQENWMHDHQHKIQACMLGVGQAFLVYAGLEKRLPVWMRNLSLEWAYRFIQEPKRLWKRYLITNSFFMHLVFKSFFNRVFRAGQKELKIDPHHHIK